MNRMWTKLFLLAITIQVTLAKPLYNFVNTFQNAEGDVQIEVEFFPGQRQNSANSVRGIVKKLGETVGSAVSTSTEIADKTVETADQGIQSGFNKLSQISSAAVHLPITFGHQLKKHATIFAEGFKDGYKKTQES